MGPILRVEDLRIEGAHRDKAIVEGVNFALMRGEVLGLIGESGAGKSTIALATLAYTRPGCVIASGRILFDGADLRTLSLKQIRAIRGRHIAYVAQSAAAAFDPTWRIERQVSEVLVRHGLMSWSQARKMSIECFKDLDLPSPETIGSRFPHQVSGGQLQRCMAAMAMSCCPEILILDEPTTGLDVTTQIEVLTALRKLIRDSNTSALYISHDLAVVAQLANRIMVLRHGRIVEEGPANEMLHRPRQKYTRELVSVRASDSTAPLRQPTNRPEVTTVLKLENVTASYRTFVHVVRGLSLVVNAGETLAVVGESGSGKSTLARVICGLLPLDWGTIEFCGKVLSSTLAGRSRDELRRIQMVYQMPDVALNPRHTVREILGRPVALYFGADRAGVRSSVAELLDMVDLPKNFVDRRPGELSGGEKQRVCIARALAAKPELMICDEVTSALDPLIADGIIKLLIRLQEETGVSYLFIAHDLGVVRRVADRVGVMHCGGMVAEGPIAHVFSPPYHPYTEKLLSSVPEMRLDWLDEVLAARAG